MEALIVLGVLALIAVITIFAGVKTVPQGTQWTVERFGRYRATLMPGLNLIIPYVDRIGHKINVQETVLEVPSQTVITRDNASVTVDGVVFFQILEAQKAAYEVANLHNAIINLSLTNIRTAIGAMDLDETLSKRDEINSRLLDVLDRATHPWGIKITRVELKDVRPPEDVIAAMSQQLTADRQKRAQVLQAEGFRQSEILKAEGQKQAQILAAEGRLEAARRDAEARERLAQAEAAATRSVSEAVASGDVRALNYFVAQKYVEALNTIGAAHNTKLVLMPLEASGVIGAIAGIAELTRDVAAAGAAPGGAGSGGARPPAGGPWTQPRA
jgi:regulator of protease activity HflC (stomatin/prohibitin superfamily)